MHVKNELSRIKEYYNIKYNVFKVLIGCIIMIPKEIHLIIYIVTFWKGLQNVEL